MNRLTKKY